MPGIVLAKLFEQSGASNSFYGITLLPYFKYYDPNLGSAITTSGQVFIINSKEILDDVFYKILGEKREYVTYCDTDSAYVHIQSLIDKHCVGKSDKEIVDFVENFVFKVVQPELNKRLAALTKTLGVDDCMLDMKLECIGPSMVFCAKKKYMFDILYSEGVRYQEPKMKVMGIEIVRSSTPSVVKEYLKTAAKMCLSGNEKELHEYVEYVKKQFFSLDYTQVSFPRGCNGISTYASDSGIYKSGTPMHVRAALLHNHYLKEMGLHTKYPLISDGDKIKFIALNKKNPFREDVIGFHNKLPDEFDIVKYIDWEMQFQKAFIAPLEAITSSIDWATKEQPSLDSLFD